MNKLDEKDLAEACADSVNAMGFKEATFVETMRKQHRTLQQNFTRLCLAWLAHLATLEENQYDLRNEQSVLFAKKIKSVIDETHLPFI